MAAKLARCVRRQHRLARTDRLPPRNDLLPTPVQQPDAETLCIFALLARLITFCKRFQWVYNIPLLICAVHVWAPLIETNYLHRCEEHRRSLERLHGPMNFTKPCSTGCGGEADDFTSESWFCLFNTLSCVVLPTWSCTAMLVLGLIRAIKHCYRHRVFEFCELTFICLIFSSISNQIVSAFATRPLSMSLDLRFLSMLGIQWIGFGLCLAASFTYGVKHAIHYAKLNRGGLE